MNYRVRIAVEVDASSEAEAIRRAAGELLAFIDSHTHIWELSTDEGESWFMVDESGNLYPKPLEDRTSLL